MKSVAICAIDDLKPGDCRAVRIGGEDIALVNVGGEIHAIENACLHAGAALSGGRLEGSKLACPVHGWRYDVTTGALCVAPDRKLRTFPVTIADGKVAVHIQA